MNIKLITTVVFSFLYSILMVACKPATNDFSLQENNRFFSLKDYFKQEIGKLAEKGKAQKIVEVDGKHENQIIDTIDYSKELGVFSSSDINRPAWSDKYEVDSVFNSSKELVQLNFNELDKKLNTHLVSVSFEHQVVSRVYIENITESPIATSIQHLTYIPSFGYTIESIQKSKIRGEHDFKIDVRFMTND